jgi:hypothetical protein
MPIPISQLPPDLVWNGQLDVSNPIKQTKYNQLNAEWEARNRTTSYSPAPARSPEEYAQAVIDAGKAEIDAERKLAEELFGTNNPFVFDEYLAKESASQEYLPYYTELLEDYLGKVGVSRDTVQDEKKLLNALRTTSTGTAGAENRSYDRAVAEAERGFAGSGMFFSGIKSTKLGQAEAEKEYSVGDTAGEVSRTNRDLFGPGRQYQTAVAGGVEQRRGEQLKEFYAPKVQTYKRRFPTGSDMLSGYLPEEYLRY